jgi:RNA polymerase sigma-70 factor (ECF subfamily)
MKRTGIPDDRALIESCIQGDTEAWTTFTTRYSPLILIAAKNRLRKYGLALPVEEIHDIRQQVLASLWRNGRLSAIRNRADISCWLAIVSGNAAIEYVRKNRSHLEDKPLSLSERFDDIALGDIVPSNDKGPLDKMADEELLNKIHEAIDRLPEKERLVMKLSLLHDKKYEEISEILNMPMGTVSSYMKRAKEKLKNILEKYLSRRR